MYVSSPQDNTIKVRDLSGNGELKTLVQDARLHWPDTVAEGPDGTINFATSHIRDSAFYKPEASAVLPTELWEFQASLRILHLEIKHDRSVRGARFVILTPPINVRKHSMAHLRYGPYLEELEDYEQETLDGIISGEWNDRDARFKTGRRCEIQPAQIIHSVHELL